MARQKTEYQRIVEKKMNQIREARAKNKPINLDLDPNDVQAVNKALAKDKHAPLTKGEQALMRLNREGDGGHSYDRLRGWTPKMYVDPEMQKPYAVEIAAKKKALEQKRVSAMTPEEQDLYDLEQKQAELIAEQQAAESHVARMADPKVKSALERLKELDAATALDPGWSWDETVVIAKAIVSIETTGSDLDAALTLAAEAFNIDRRKKLATMTEHQREIERIQTEVQIRQQELETLGYSVASDDAPSVPAPEDDPIEALWQAWEASPSDETLTALNNALITKEKAESAQSEGAAV